MDVVPGAYLAPDVLAKVIALLKQHPDYRKDWEGKLNSVPEEARDVDSLGNQKSPIPP